MTTLIPTGEMAAAVDTFLAAQPPARRWDADHLDWTHADAGRLTEGQRSAVRFVTMIEDHLPGYVDVYHRHFPVDASVGPAVFAHHRELYHFTARWAAEEDTHARALARYQWESGLADRDALRTELAGPGAHPFGLDYTHPVQYFTYALVQEKATQIYYRQLRDLVDEPVLATLLGLLARDEARHFSFFADVVGRYLRAHGDAVVAPIRDVVADFRMPLADMGGYWRWALRIADVARYDHTDAYAHLVRAVDRAVDTRTDRLDELVRFVDSCRTLTPTGGPA
ncbi:acyl-ACP desaturase [Actinomycetospora chiangmaiensis]|uniref:acyl-ACP desaturase n=1 Tax=Actinomycetospora chiangmaiensis TaxID=402650 RepID=UPI00039EF0A6|nr:acyl-ACP desaturase [Actinomycetospora chiangmaiensis]